MALFVSATLSLNTCRNVKCSSTVLDYHMTATNGKEMKRALWITVLVLKYKKIKMTLHSKIEQFRCEMNLLN